MRSTWRRRRPRNTSTTCSRRRTRSATAQRPRERATAIVPGAGSGERLGAGVPKALVGLAGRPMIAWSLQALAAAESIDDAVLAAPPGKEEELERLAAEVAPGLPVTVVTGGKSRSESVAIALASADGGLIVVHDAARPLLEPELADRCVERLR